MGVILTKKAKSKIIKIFEHPNEVYSVYLKDSDEDSDDVVWIEGKVNLYAFLQQLSN